MIGEAKRRNGLSSSPTSLASHFLDVLMDNLIFTGPHAGGLQALVAASVLPMITTLVVWRSRTTIEVTDPEKLQWIQLWLAHQREAVSRVRHLFLVPSKARGAMMQRRHSYNTHHGDDDDDDSSSTEGRFAPPNFTFLPAAGVSAWTWLGGWPVSVASLTSTSSSSMMRSAFYDMDMSGTATGYKLTIWLAPMGSAIAKNLLLQGRQLWLAKRALKTEIWMCKTNHSPACFDITTKKSRPLDSVIIENGIKESLLEDAQHFLRSEEWYVRKGIPYRRGYLLHGPPGCGKTSLITALAGTLRLPIVLLPLGSRRMGDDQLQEAISAAPRDSLILIEDVDCAFPNENENTDRFSRGITLSGLLNAIDGVAAQEGRLIFLTTNHKERLTEALIRPGRVDVQHYLGPSSKEGAGELFDQFFKPCNDDASKEVQRKAARCAFLDQVLPNVHSFARLQGILMESRDNPALAAKGMCDLFKEKSDPFDLGSFTNKLHKHRTSRMERLEDSFEDRLEMLQHASKCNGCTSKSCKNWKNAIAHVRGKDCKDQSNCKNFQVIVRLSMVHARKCASDTCLVPFCKILRTQEKEEEKAFVESLWEQHKSSNDSTHDVTAEETKSEKTDAKQDTIREAVKSEAA